MVVFYDIMKLRWVDKTFSSFLFEEKKLIAKVIESFLDEKSFNIALFNFQLLNALFGQEMYVNVISILNLTRMIIYIIAKLKKSDDQMNIDK